MLCLVQNERAEEGMKNGRKARAGSEAETQTQGRATLFLRAPRPLANQNEAQQHLVFCP